MAIAANIPKSVFLKQLQNRALQDHWVQPVTHSHHSKQSDPVAASGWERHIQSVLKYLPHWWLLHPSVQPISVSKISNYPFWVEILSSVQSKPPLAQIWRVCGVQSSWPWMVEMLEKGNGTSLPPSSPRAASNDYFEKDRAFLNWPSSCCCSHSVPMFLSSTHLTSGKASVLLTSLNMGI